MSLLNVPKYFKAKTIKLSDSYAVIIDFDRKGGKEEFRCSGFTIPKIAEWSEEVYKYGNTGQKFIVPKTDLVQEVTIDIMEQSLNGRLLTESQFFRCLQNGGQEMGKGFMVARRYDARGYATNKGTYIDAIDIPSLTICILNNALDKTVYEYRFTNLKLTNAQPYELSYQDESFTKWALSFTFETMVKGVPDDKTFDRGA